MSLSFKNEDYPIFNNELIDSVVSAEIPDEEMYPELYQLVKQHMIHGPCGYQNLNSPCMNKDKSKCTKKFSKAI